MKHHVESKIRTVPFQREDSCANSCQWLFYSTLPVLFLILLTGCYAYHEPVAIERLHADFTGEFPPPRVPSSEELAEEAGIGVPVPSLSVSGESLSESRVRPVELSLTDCVTLALRNNTGLLLAGAGIETSRIDERLAFWKFYPTAAVSASYRGYLYDDYKEKKLIIPGVGSFGGVGGFDTRPSLQSSFGVNWDPDLRGANKWAWRAARAAWSGSAADYSETLRKIRFAVTAQYISIIRKNREIETLEKSIEELEGQLAVTRKLLEQAQITRNEVLLVEVALAGRRLQLDAAETGRKKLVHALNELMGIPVGNQTRFEDWKRAPVPVKPEHLPSLKHLLDAAFSANPRIESVRRRIDAAAASLEAVRRESLPQITVSAAYVNNTQQSSEFTPKNIATVQADLSWPLFTGGQVAGNMQKMRWQIFVLRCRLRSESESLEHDVRDVLLDARLAARSVLTAEISLRQALESLRIAKQLHENDRNTRQDILDAEENVFSRQTELEYQNLNYLLALKQLESLTGMPIEEITERRMRPRQPIEPENVPVEEELLDIEVPKTTHFSASKKE